MDQLELEALVVRLVLALARRRARQLALVLARLLALVLALVPVHSVPVHSVLVHSALVPLVDPSALVPLELALDWLDAQEELHSRLS